MQNLKPGTLDYRILLAFIEIKDNIKPGQLKDMLHISHSTLNSALERMQIDGLLKWTHYGPIILEKKGEDARDHVKNHQHLIKLFLKESLHLDDKEAEEESLNLAPYFSCKLIDKLVNKYPKCSAHDHHSDQLDLCDV